MPDGEWNSNPRSALVTPLDAEVSPVLGYKMRSLGSSKDDRRDRGNYTPGFQIINNTLDYASGIGPLAVNGLKGGHKPDLSDLKRLIPAVYSRIP